ncbi:MAG TPA: hypothetical protein VGL55_12300 [Steroidobacteraceae bacterium]|jgi:hypothetical protein
MRAIAIVLMALASPCVLAYTADELATRNVEARGGADKVNAIRTLRMSGKLLLNDGALELGYTALIRRPGSIRYEAALQGLTKVQAYDGKQAWQINPFQGRKDAEKLSDDDAKGLGEDAADFIGTLVDYKAKGYRLDYLGTQDVDGTQAHKLRVTRPNGDTVLVYLDPDYFLEIRTIERRVEHGVPSETVTDYGDYEKVDGVYFALAQESGPKGSANRQKIQFDKAEANVPADEGEFRLPPAAAAAAK